MFLFLNIFWLARTVKYVFFWVYLWQLKEYHVGRFVDHFKTHKGKKLFFSYLGIIKVILLVLFFTASDFFSLWFLVLFIIYLIESLIFFRQIALKNIKKPVKTAKTVFLLGASFIIAGFFIAYVCLYPKEDLQPAWLLMFDILLPAIVSFIVLFFQPFFVAVRNSILKKAGLKLKDFKNLTVICITGSYGKTSTKEFLATILSKKFKILSTDKHQNSEIGIAKLILSEKFDKLMEQTRAPISSEIGARPSTKNNFSAPVFIAETGAYNKGKVKEVCSILKPKIGIVTGVNEQHLALFGSMENLLSAEGGRELATSLPENGFLILNGDNKYCLDLYKRSENFTKAQVSIYSVDRNKVNADIHAEDAVATESAVSFSVVDKNRNLMHFKVNVLGKQNVQNLLAAILVASELGMTLEEISDACGDIKPEQAGMIKKNGKHGLNILDSSYSANPDGVLADLDYLSIFSQKKIIVMPCLIELGEKSAQIHEKIGRKIGQICDIAIITSRDKYAEIKKGAISSGMLEKDILLCDNIQEIYSVITLFCKSGDTILLEGRVPMGLGNLLTSQ